MKIQIFIDKKSKKITGGWGAGDAYYKSDKFDTILVDINKEDYKKLEAGEMVIIDYKNRKLKLAPNPVIKERKKQEQEKETLRRKLKRGEYDLKSLQKIIADLI